MASKLGDIMFPNGKYQKDGEEKTSWLRCGVLLQTDNGMRIKLDALPVNMQEGWFSVFEDRDKPAAAPKQEGFRKPAEPEGDDTPF